MFQSVIGVKELRGNGKRQFMLVDETIDVSDGIF